MPNVGDSVIYTRADSAERAALVQRVNSDGLVDLAVFSDHLVDMGRPAVEYVQAVDAGDAGDEGTYRYGGTRGVGTDVVDMVGADAPEDGDEGTGAGVAGPGSTYRCTGTPALYINTGTKAEPAWAALAEDT